MCSIYSGIQYVYTCIAWNGYLWVVGGGGSTVSNGIQTLLYSYDGITFYPGKGGPTYVVFDILWNVNIWVCQGTNTVSTVVRIYTSYDGINWTQGTFASAVQNQTTHTLIASRTVLPYLPIINGQPYSPARQSDWPSDMIPWNIPMALDMIATFIRNYETYVQFTGFWPV